jgi:hypothetical protein
MSGVLVKAVNFHGNVTTLTNVMVQTMADPGDGGYMPTGLKHRGLERNLYVKK